MKRERVKTYLQLKLTDILYYGSNFPTHEFRYIELNSEFMYNTKIWYRESQQQELKHPNMLRLILKQCENGWNRMITTPLSIWRLWWNQDDAKILGTGRGAAIRYENERIPRDSFTLRYIKFCTLHTTIPVEIYYWNSEVIFSR